MVVAASSGLVSCVVSDTVGSISTPQDSGMPDSSVPDSQPPPPPPPPPEPTPQQKARDAFNLNVHPVLVAKCLGCHTTAGGAKAPPFISPDVKTAYDIIVGKPTVVGDFTDKGAKVYAFVQGGHFGPYAARDQGKLLVWLGLELQARTAAPTTP